MGRANILAMQYRCCYEEMIIFQRESSDHKHRRWLIDDPDDHGML